MINTAFSQLSYKKVYADSVMSHRGYDGVEGYEVWYVKDHNNVVDTALSTYASLTTRTVTLVNIKSHIQVRLSEKVGTSRVGVDTNGYVYCVFSDKPGDEFLSYILGGTIGGLLDMVIAGTPVFTIKLKNNSVVVDSVSIMVNKVKVGTKDTVSVIGGDKLVYMPDGKLAVRIKPRLAINNVEIIFSATPALGAEYNTRLHAVYYERGLSSDCEAIQYTAASSSGIDISVVKSSPISNPHYAIDNIDSTYSLLGGSGILSIGVGQVITQRFYFNENADEGEMPVVRIKPNMSVLNVEVLKFLKVKVYNKGSLMLDTLLYNLLDVDLLLLANINKSINVPIPYQGEYDVIDVMVIKPISVDVAFSPFRLYGVKKVPEKPYLGDMTVKHACAGVPQDFTIQNPVDGANYRWFKVDRTGTETNLIQVGSGLTYVDSFHLRDAARDTIYVGAYFCDSNYTIYSSIIIQADETLCQKATISGNLITRDLDSHIPVYAVLTDSVTNDVIASQPIAHSTGYYEFNNIPKGSYLVKLYSGDVVPTTTYSTTELPYGYQVIDDSLKTKLIGDGEDGILPTTPIVWNGPDMITGLSAGSSRLSKGEYTMIDYSIRNRGGMDSRGDIEFRIQKPENGTLSVEALPSGVSLLDEDEEWMFFKLDEVVVPGYATRKTVRLKYLADDKKSTASVRCYISNSTAKGGSERAKDKGNNTSTEFLIYCN